MRSGNRVGNEKQTPAKLTGWSMSQINGLPGARDVERHVGAQRLQLVPQIEPEPQAMQPLQQAEPEPLTWWQRRWCAQIGGS